MALDLAQRSAYTLIAGQLLEVAITAGSFVDGVPYSYNRPLQTKLWEVPTTEQLNRGGTPFVSVRFGTLAGFQTPDGLVAPGAARGPGQYQPVWDWEVIVLHPYDQDFPNYGDAGLDVANLLQVFIQNRKINGSCDSSEIQDANPGYFELLDSGAPWCSARLVIRTFEILSLQSP